MKKAFTLAELLIVVLVLGVLAAVSTPKMKKVLDTQKTTEAENMLAAVRTEQEKRCTMGKNYQRDPDQVAVLASAKESKNYTYSLSRTGIVASNTSGYSIEMPSYKEGTLCCRGEYCNQLNKDYPTCPDTLNVADDECAAEEFKCDESARPSDTTTACANGYGSSSVTYSCRDGAWVATTTSTCCGGAVPATSQSCPAGSCGIQTRTVSCDNSTGTWVEGAWTSDCEALPAAETVVCNVCGTKEIKYGCNSNYDPNALTVYKKAEATYKTVAFHNFGLMDWFKEYNVDQNAEGMWIPAAAVSFDINKLSISQKLFATANKFVITDPGTCSVSDSSTCPTPECFPGTKNRAECLICSSAGQWQEFRFCNDDITASGGGCVPAAKLFDENCIYIQNQIKRTGGHFECTFDTTGNGGAPANGAGNSDYHNLTRAC